MTTEDTRLLDPDRVPETGLSTDPIVPENTQRGIALCTQPGPHRYIGLKGYVTNLMIAKVPAIEVVAAYHDLFQVEASFRMAKTDLRARPMFASTAGSISAHLTIVFAALAISRHLYATSGVTIRRIVRALRPLRDVTISVGGHQLTATTPPEGEAADILARIHA